MPWTKEILDRFIADMEGVMTEQQEKVLRLHVADMLHVEIANELHVSLSTVERRISVLKLMYDRAQASDPMLPPRVVCGGVNA